MTAASGDCLAMSRNHARANFSELAGIKEMRGRSLDAEEVAGETNEFVLLSHAGGTTVATDVGIDQ